MKDIRPRNGKLFAKQNEGQKEMTGRRKSLENTSKNRRHLLFEIMKLIS